MLIPYLVRVPFLRAACRPVADVGLAGVQCQRRGSGGGGGALLLSYSRHNNNDDSSARFSL